MTGRMPVLFVGHGSPMNAIEQNEYTETWKQIAEKIPRPEAILSVSAHWFTEGNRIQTAVHPRQIYDMYGFPKELYEVHYHATGNKALSERVIQLIRKKIITDDSRGIDHGTWAVLCRMYPRADIPVVQLSVNRGASFQEQYETGQNLQQLRDNGILILASGNVVHNLAMIDWNKNNGFSWADSFDNTIRDAVLAGDVPAVIHTASSDTSARLAVPASDHFAPLLYALGAAEAADTVTVFNNSRTLGSLSMTGFIFG
jgi:4,5-DOPA dioxygenase extradiol